ncbi:DegT/DnrJ/EryC1/StrS family aminotransferase [Candidatus Bathyarchaeota archaeon]|nr:DegT/DnrJ/EryC1/StrS family aminotransferase [Candidatus Bathyarchaeota archaeon]
MALHGGEPASATPVRLACPRFSGVYKRHLEDVLSSGYLRERRYTRMFEKSLSRRLGAGHGCAVSSGTSALWAALTALSNPGGEVIVPAFTFEATAGVAVRCGLKPVFVDVDPSTYLLDVGDVNEKIGDGTVAVIPVHLFGNVVDMRALNEIAEDHGLIVVGDCCQAIGSRHRGEELGGLHDLCCYSFYPSKVITTGEGGMVTTDDPGYADRLYSIKAGNSLNQTKETVGQNLRFDDVRAALGLDQLELLDGFVSERRRLAEKLTEIVGGFGCLTPQRIEKETESCYNYYTVRLDLDSLSCSRDVFVDALRAEGVECGVYYPSPLTLHPLFMEGAAPCPEAEELSRGVFSLPIHPFLTERDLGAIGEALWKAVSYFLR